MALNGSSEIYYEAFGDPSDPTLLLVNGLGSQCINYHEDWCAMFVARGLHVVRFDNRDVGMSSKFDTAPVGAQGEAYTVSDMAADGVAVLDAIGVEHAHVMGLSMGGMIVQVMAVEQSHRLLSMTSVMSRTGEPGYGGSTPEAFALLTAPPAVDRQSFIAAHVEGLRVWGSPAFADEARWRREAERAFDRCFHPSGPARQYRAVEAAPPRGELLRHVTTPSLVMHGDCDTLIDISGGRRTAELIPGARFEVIEGLGHDYPPQLWGRWVDLVSSFVASTSRAA
jgi:pimeloyl-ACP methyl ester carboxylesterase